MGNSTSPYALITFLNRYMKGVLMSNENPDRDKSKGNAISKGLMMFQATWFFMQLQVITRAIYHLETMQLEVGTLAFAVLNFLTYAVW
ncbi:hypothetical protein BDR06DRAFT_1052222 [Suillus hirtellus]|nr:hypothetical protein BDR06DRAFT_1052222 [Suillus hirtellus]